MKQTNHTKKIIFLAFLLSLLFHTGSIIYITIQKSHQDSAVAIPDKGEKTLPKKNKPHDEWVETKAHASNFGAPVFFQDEPEFTPPASDQVIENKPNTAEMQEQELPQEKEESTKSIIPEAKQEITDNKPTATLQESEIKSASAKKAVPQKRPQSKPHMQPSKPIAAPKPPLTLAQLSQGFLNHVKQEGSHAIHMLGKKNGTPTDEQIKYERYLQKLSWCLQNSFNIHNDRFPTSASIEDTIQVLLALNKDGSMKNCRISKTSGNRDLDYFTLFIFNDASTSFPPVPEYLPHDPFTITYIIMVSGSEESRLKLYRR